MAQQYLIEKGLIYIQRNFRSKMGEIDLIMQDTNTLVFVEVRYRKNTFFGEAVETVDRRKQIKLIRTAEYYLAYHEKYAKMPCRFDVVGLHGHENQAIEFNWIKNAFEH